jgi:hypothetical protein
MAKRTKKRISFITLFYQTQYTHSHENTILSPRHDDHGHRRHDEI